MYMYMYNKDQVLDIDVDVSVASVQPLHVDVYIDISNGNDYVHRVLRTR